MEALETVITNQGLYKLPVETGPCIQTKLTLFKIILKRITLCIALIILHKIETQQMNKWTYKFFLGVSVFLTRLWVGSSEESPQITKISTMADCTTSFPLYIV